MEETIQAKTTVDFRPFNAPNFATFVLGGAEKGSIPLKDLDREVLDQLTAKWLDHVYASVGRPSPFYRASQDKAA